MGSVPFPVESSYKKTWHFSNSSLNWCTRTHIRHTVSLHGDILAKSVLMKVIWPWEIFLRVWISSFRKINLSSFWFTNRGERVRQKYGIVWIIHCWNGLFGVSKPHQKGNVLYLSCSLCHVLTISIIPCENGWQRPCTAMVKKSSWRMRNVSLLLRDYRLHVKSFDFC